MSDDSGRAPTRRSLREQRRASETADGGHDRGQVTGEQPAAESDPRSSEDTNELDRVAHANRSRRAADVPFDMVPERDEAGEPGERSSLQRARDREALRVRRDASAQPKPTPVSDDEPAPLTRRQLRLQALAAARSSAQEQESETPVAHAEESSTATEDDPSTQESLSVEEALEARRKKATGQQGEPEAEAQDDLEVLARQRELAARAAIISRRVAERERLKRAHSTRTPEGQAGDPFTGAMDKLRREQAERDLANTGINAPQTSGFHIEMPGTGKAPKVVEPAPETVHEAFVEESGEPKPSKSAADETSGEAARQPVSARSAQGLDPLDYRTAGARRANVWAWAVLGVLLVGAAALVTGIVMITTNG